MENAIYRQTMFLLNQQFLDVIYMAEPIVFKNKIQVSTKFETLFFNI